MEIRFNTTNSKVEKALEQIRKNERKYFVEEAIVHYLKYLEVDRLATSLFLDVAKINQETIKSLDGEIEQDSIDAEEDNEDDEDEDDVADNDDFAGSW